MIPRFRSKRYQKPVSAACARCGVSVDTTTAASTQAVLYCDACLVQVIEERQAFGRKFQKRCRSCGALIAGSVCLNCISYERGSDGKG